MGWQDAPVVEDTPPAAKRPAWMDAPEVSSASGLNEPQDTGAAAIPVSATQTYGQAQRARAATAAPPPPPATFGDKIVGAIDAGLNIVRQMSPVNVVRGVVTGKMTPSEEVVAHTGTALTTGALGMAGGFLGGVAGNVAARAGGAPTPAPGADIGIEQAATEGAEKLTYAPRSPEAQRTVEQYVTPVMQAAAPLMGHMGEVGAIHTMTGAAKTKAGGTVPMLRDTAAEIVPGVRDTAQVAADLARERKMNAPENQGIVNAIDAGYKVTQKAGRGAKPAQIVETMAGRARTAQEMAAHNAENTAKLARQDIGVPDDTALTPEVTNEVREEAGKAYNVLDQVGRVDLDDQFRADVQRVAEPFIKGGEDFKTLAENPIIQEAQNLAVDSADTKSITAVVRNLRNEANKAFRADDKQLATSYRALAEATDNAMSRALDRVEQADPGRLPEGAMDAYRAARVRIAKSYLLDDAMNGKPGEVDAKVYGRALRKNVPLSGPGRQIGEFANQFGEEGLAKKKGRSGEVGPTYHDIVLAALHAARGGLEAVATAGARPVARAILGSELVQRRLRARAAGELPAREPVAPPAVPPEPTTSPGAAPEPPEGGGGGGTPPSPLGDLTPDWETTGLVRPLDEAPPTTGSRRAPLEIPAVPGRPDLPDTMVVGRPGEVAASEAANAAMGEPGAVAARRAQEAPPPNPKLAEVERLKASTQSPAVRKALDEHAAALKAEDAQREAARQRVADAAELDRTASNTLDPELRKRLRAQADKLRGEKPEAGGKATEGQPEIKTEKPGKIPVGKATELAVERIEPEGDLPVGEATELPVEYVEPKGWRESFKLGEGDAQRAHRVAAALAKDADAVEAAARQHENSPRAFDRAIDQILEKTDENASGRAAQGGEGAGAGRPGAEAGAEHQRGAAAPAAGERAGAERAAAPRAERGATEPAGGQAAGGAKADAGVDHRAHMGAQLRASNKLRAMAEEARARGDEGERTRLMTESRKRFDLAMQHQEALLTEQKKAAAAAKRAATREAKKTEGLPGFEPGDTLEKFGPRGMKGNAWVLREKATGKAVMETSDPAKVRALNTEKYEAVPIGQHLAETNAAAGRGGVEIREVPGGFDAYKDGKKVGYLRDNLERGQAEQLGENASVDIVKVDKDVQGTGVGRALYEAFNEKHGGRIMPSGKTEPPAWKLWKRNYPEKVDIFVKQEAQRIRAGADRQLVLGNIKDPEIAQRVAQEAADGTSQRQRSQPGDVRQGGQAQEGAQPRRILEARQGEEGGQAKNAPGSAAARAADLNDEVFKKGDADFEAAGPVVDGLRVRDSIPNTGSIRSSFENYEVLPGVRKVPRSAFSAPPAKPSARVLKLAEEIQSNGELNPLIVVDDGHPDGLYVLEGAHRFDALDALGKKEFPAIVVRDLDTLLERKGGEAFKPVGSAEAMEGVLRAKFGDKLIQGLLDQGLLNMIAKADDVREAPPTAKAVFREGPRPGATMFFDKLTAEEAPGVLMHELGEHFGIRRLLGDDRYRVMLGELRDIRNEPAVREAWDTVKRNYKLDEEDPNFLREVAAHLVETQPDLPFVRRLVNEIRAYFYQHFGTTMGNRVDASLIRGLAASALRSAAKGELTRRPMRFDRTPIPQRPGPRPMLQ